MRTKAVIVLCAQVFLVQAASSQYLNRIGPGLAPQLGTRIGPLTNTIGPLPGLTGNLGSPLADNLGPLTSPKIAPLNGPKVAPLAVPKANPLSGTLGTSGLALALSYDSCGVASSGGTFPVTSASPFAPTGVSVISENAIEGALAIEGNLPLLGSVAVEGAFPTAGAGAISYGCGNNAVLIETEGPISTGVLAPRAVGIAPVRGSVSALAPSLTGPVAPGLLCRGTVAPGRGCGCGYY